MSVERLSREQTAAMLDAWELEDRESPDAGTVDSVVATVRRWLWMPDPTPVLAVLGTVAANERPGDPLWLMLVGAPGSGKSEILQSTVELPDVYEAATITEGSLLSGTSKKERAQNAKGGLLREIGQYGIIVAKDFGSVLSMHRETRGQTLAALREIFDGSWTRHVGTDGGRTLAWKGKIGFMAGATPTVDRHHTALASMGERFLTLRMPESDQAAQAGRSLHNVGREGAMRYEMARAVNCLFAEGLSDPLPLTDSDRDRLVDMAVFSVAARSATFRDHNGNLEYSPPSEAPGRLVKQLAGILLGLDGLKVPRSESWPVVARIALDSLPPLRLQVIDELHRQGERAKTNELAEAIANPSRTIHRTLEDLAAHSVVIRWSQGSGKADLWELSQQHRDRYGRVLTTLPDTSHGVGGTLPETSQGVDGSGRPQLLIPPCAPTDIPGKVARDASEERGIGSQGDSL